MSSKKGSGAHGVRPDVNFKNKRRREREEGSAKPPKRANNERKKQPVWPRREGGARTTGGFSAAAPSLAGTVEINPPTLTKGGRGTNRAEVAGSPLHQGTCWRGIHGLRKASRVWQSAPGSHRDTTKYN